MYKIILNYHDHSNADSNASNNMKFGVKTSSMASGQLWTHKTTFGIGTKDFVLFYALWIVQKCIFTSIIV